ncbi:GNAT family N-acetyltransferase [Myroides indicus]|uniref:RimJ/RimL family protein N-acetyltransferase n=1 Tax=Myroides indicus TaxID=1323422 RepID=A0A4R7F2Z1_9FLAO|nr:GNAT family N-acetyltransferase [Myroides indicus]TDS64306.1 RimJ/RimL family protein N-acetyltransferase [Myroides indicus]
MTNENVFYRELTIGDVPWQDLTHWNGKADDIPSLLKIIEEDGTIIGRMALLTLAGCIEKDQKIIVITPIILIFLCRLLIVKSANQDLILRILLKVSQALAGRWSLYYNQQDCLFNTIDILWKEPTFLNKNNTVEIEEDENLQKYIWHYCVDVLNTYKPIFEKVAVKDGIEQGIIFEILTIVKMVKPQKRKIFGKNRSWQSFRLIFTPITEEHQTDLMKNLTRDVTRYLSFDLIPNPLFIKLYVQSSETEYARGAAIVLAIKDKKTNEFLGSCGIHDINEESAELGLWLKSEAQGKGLGVEIVHTLLKIAKDECKVKCAVYSVEKDNSASHVIAEKVGFKKDFEFILEPTAIKNRMREMVQYKLELV